MRKENKLASTIAYLNYEYLRGVAKLCGEPVDGLIDRVAKRSALDKKPALKKEGRAPSTTKPVKPKSGRAA